LRNQRGCVDGRGATAVDCRSGVPVCAAAFDRLGEADPTSAILQYCASSPDKFYELTNSNQIITTFQSIGTALSKLRVAM
jgi:hypothetical protein